jgi:hypothetical protein
VGAESSRVIVQSLRDLVGGEPVSTLSQNQLNYVKRVDNDNVWVETRKSIAERTGPQPIPIDWIEDSLDTLRKKRVLTREDLGPKASKRSAFIFALLARLPEVESTTNPIMLRIKDRP